jgi:hypothetical protein
LSVLFTEQEGSGMSLSREEMDRRIDEHFGFEASDDVEGVLATLDPDVEHDIVGWRPFYETLFGDLSDGAVRSTRRLYGRDFMVDDSVWSGRAPGRPFGLEGRNRPLEFRLLHVFEFNDEGSIQRENVWIDLASILQQLPQD